MSKEEIARARAALRPHEEELRKRWGEENFDYMYSEALEAISRGRLVRDILDDARRGI